MVQSDRPLDGVRVCCSLRSSYPISNARTLKIAESLSAAGAEVRVLYVSPPDVPLPSGNFRAVRVGLRKAVEIRASHHRVRIVRVAYNLLVATPLRTVLQWPRRYGFDGALLRSMLEARADVYHAYVLDTAVMARIAATVRRAKLIYDVRDFYVDSRRSGLTPPQVRFWSWAERHLSRSADLVLAISEPMADVIRSSSGSRRVATLLNGPWECAHSVQPVRSPVRLLFQGYFEADRNLEALIGAMEHLRGRATLTLQGWGGIEADLRRLADSLDLDGHVFFVPACGPSEVVKSARKYDVGIVCHRGSTLNHDIAAPNKLMDYIGAGLAVAGSNLPGIRSVIEPEGCGVLIDPASAESIAVDLGAMLSDPEGLARMKAASVRACRRLSWDVQVRKLVGLYLGLLAKGKHGGVAA